MKKLTSKKPLMCALLLTLACVAPDLLGMDNVVMQHNQAQAECTRLGGVVNDLQARFNQLQANSANLQLQLSTFGSQFEMTYTTEVKTQFNKIAEKRDHWKQKGKNRKEEIAALMQTVDDLKQQVADLTQQLYPEIAQINIDNFSAELTKLIGVPRYIKMEKTLIGRASDDHKRIILMNVVSNNRDEAICLTSGVHCVESIKKTTLHAIFAAIAKFCKLEDNLPALYESISIDNFVIGKNGIDSIVNAEISVREKAIAIKAYIDSRDEGKNIRTSSRKNPGGLSPDEEWLFYYLYGCTGKCPKPVG